jgi:hypothetical protein
MYMQKSGRKKKTITIKKLEITSTIIIKVKKRNPVSNFPTKGS